tara:strand:+ start:210 stop:1370 length:1161 start_codon:yes stop_codon:yes gene_type:complete
MSKNVYEPDELYRLYRTGSNETVDDGRFRLRRPWFDSRWTKLLLPEDRGIIENRCFNYLIVEPTALPAEGSHDVLVILHGLNEGSYGRMLPWACSFAHQLNIPVILFPLAFHVDRRSDIWNTRDQGRIFAHRLDIPGNSMASSFNARISERLFQAPERYYLGGLQSYLDVLDLMTKIRSGGHESCRTGTRVHFLGYSAGGYLALILLLSDLQSRFSDCRMALFGSGAPLDGIQLESLFIMDKSAAQKLSAYLQNKSFLLNNALGEYRALVETPTHWFTQVLFHGDDLVKRMKVIQDRLLVVVNSSDQVISAEKAVWNLRPAPVLRLDLGVHEFPFTIGTPLPNVYDRREPATRTMIRNLRHIHHIGPDYKPTFDRFIHTISTFLFP